MRLGQVHRIHRRHSVQSSRGGRHSIGNCELSLSIVCVWMQDSSTFALYKSSSVNKTNILGIYNIYQNYRDKVSCVLFVHTLVPRFRSHFCGFSINEAGSAPRFQ